MNAPGGYQHPKPGWVACVHLDEDDLMEGVDMLDLEGRTGLNLASGRGSRCVVDLMLSTALAYRGGITLSKMAG